ncbi:uncharacterized protein [Miscanthus floridulus]|uniref:uncharacterized protein isoform X3 n=1 Tax=Miscanthus floridulus TaxID=154761 RepID=UPI003458042B
MSLGRRLGVPPTAAGAAAEEEAVWPQIGTSAMGDRVPGGYLIDRPRNKADEQPQASAAEPKPANTQAPGDCFVGTPGNLGPQGATAATEPAQPAGELKRSRSFMECRSSGSSNNEENRVLLTGCTGVNAYNMENKRNRKSDNLKKLPFELIKLITNDFSEELGRGAFGQVFKGVLEDGEEVAVKMLRFMANINDKQFENEFEILKRLKHPNIVRLVGFCDEAEEEVREYKGKLIVCQRIHRALCLEYLRNGSLGKLLSGTNLGKDWPTRYRIINGICEGLEYLQEGLEFPVFHLDLKPDNILLNQEMVPKISDFGLSRLIGEENSKRTLTPLGTIGYLPPEFINYQVISKEYDIYSLGVIITKIIVTEITDYSDVADMGAEEFVEHVHEKWKKCLQEIPNYASLEVDCKQVKRCIEIARRCMENDRHKRPIIKDIVSQLDESDRHKRPIIKDIVSQLDESDRPLRRMYQILDYRVKQGPRSPRRIRCQHQSCFPEWSDGYTSDLFMEEPLGSSHKDPPSYFSTAELGTIDWGPTPLYLERESGSSDNDSPSEICHPARPEHKLKLMTDAGAPFLCDGCKEPGYGPRYRCDYGGGGQSLDDLHTRCALAGDPLVHPLFGYGKQFEFRFLHEAPSSPVHEGRRFCDACGDATRGFVYHCSEQDLDLHPCCAALPDRIILDGRAFDLHRKASRPCALCPENEGRRRWFWAYRCDVDGEAVDLHVACLKETARRSWEANNRNQDDVGGGALNVDHMLENMFGEIAGTVASFITALVFGNLIVEM